MHFILSSLSFCFFFFLLLQLSVEVRGLAVDVIFKKKRERKKENEEEGNEAITSLHTEPAWALDRLLRANVLAGRELRERKKRTAEDVWVKKKVRYTRRDISPARRTHRNSLLTYMGGHPSRGAGAFLSPRRQQPRNALPFCNRL